MHEETLAKPTQRLFQKLTGLPWLADFYLAGGTALALHIGHRTSVDLDFFTGKAFDEGRMIENLAAIGKLEILQKDRQSLTGILDEVKFSFLGYPYPILKPATQFQGTLIASVEDVACMKLDALASRGTKRDFIDLYFITKKCRLRRLLSFFKQNMSLSITTSSISRKALPISTTPKVIHFPICVNQSSGRK
jgi:hypothetical protein